MHPKTGLYPFRRALLNPLDRLNLWAEHIMNVKTLEQRIAEAIRDPKNVGELPDADSIGTVGNSECGEMLRMWIKFKEERGRRVIERATFQSFGCETAIAVASLATEMIRGKTAEEALALSGEALAPTLGPLPPMKIHCSQLVEGALRSALAPASVPSAKPTSTEVSSPAAAPSLLDKFATNAKSEGSQRIVWIESDEGEHNA